MQRTTRTVSRGVHPPTYELNIRRNLQKGESDDDPYEYPIWFQTLAVVVVYIICPIGLYMFATRG